MKPILKGEELLPLNEKIWKNKIGSLYGKKRKLKQKLIAAPLRNIKEVQNEEAIPFFLLRGSMEANKQTNKKIW